MSSDYEFSDDDGDYYDDEDMLDGTQDDGGELPARGRVMRANLTSVA